MKFPIQRYEGSVRQQMALCLAAFPLPDLPSVPCTLREKRHLKLTLQWDRESLRKCFCGMPPFYAHIRKDGANFAQIDCYSNGDDFSVVPMHPLFEEPEWIVHFLKSDINSIPFQKLLELLLVKDLYGMNVVIKTSSTILLLSLPFTI